MLQIELHSNHGDYNQALNHNGVAPFTKQAILEFHQLHLLSAGAC